MAACSSSTQICTPREFADKLGKLTDSSKMKESAVKQIWQTFRGYGDSALLQVSDEKWNAIYRKMGLYNLESILWEILSIRIVLKNSWDNVIEGNLKDLLVKLVRNQNRAEEFNACSSSLLPILSALEPKVRWGEKIDKVNSLGVVTLMALEAVAQSSVNKADGDAALRMSFEIMGQVKGPSLLGLVRLHSKPLGCNAYQKTKLSLKKLKNPFVTGTKIQSFYKKLNQNQRLMFKITLVAVNVLLVMVVIYAVYNRFPTSVKEPDWNPGYLWSEDKGAFAVPRKVEILFRKEANGPEVAHLDTNLGHFLCVDRVCKLMEEQYVEVFLSTIASIKRN